MGPTPLLTSGLVAYPLHQPTAAVVQVRARTRAEEFRAGTGDEDGEEDDGVIGAGGASSSAGEDGGKGSPGGSGGNTKDVKPKTGRMVVLGSWEMLSDAWIGKESNAALADAMTRWLLRDPAVTLGDPDNITGWRVGEENGSGGKQGGRGRKSGAGRGSRGLGGRGAAAAAGTVPAGLGQDG